MPLHLGINKDGGCWWTMKKAWVDGTIALMMIIWGQSPRRVINWPKHKRDLPLLLLPQQYNWWRGPSITITWFYCIRYIICWASKLTWVFLGLWSYKKLIIKMFYVVLALDSRSTAKTAQPTTMFFWSLINSSGGASGACVLTCNDTRNREMFSLVS